LSTVFSLSMLFVVLFFQLFFFYSDLVGGQSGENWSIQSNSL
jgi:hypothetical protein